MTELLNAWMPREQWDALGRGEDCPLCAVCQSTEPFDDYAFTVANLQLGRLRLARNQYVPGYCILICHKHVQEPYHLTATEASLFFTDMLRSAQAIERVFKPLKMNFELLGNLVPHLHAHIVPRYYGDPAPGRPINPTAQVVTLTIPEYEDHIWQLQDALLQIT
jgi:diadenosine tetraphosphate (Ap4A) HIT family hydrolase